MRRRAVCVAGLAFAFLGSTYQAVGNYWDAREFPEPGRLVDVGGYSLKLHCVGARSPTVILKAKLGDNILQWARVQPGVAKFSRVCAYDRAGYGGSGAGPLPKTSRRLAAEFHRLLAGEKSPYILVASSFGGCNARVFNGLYPDEVSGIVLADSVQEDQDDLLPVWWNGPA